MPEGLIPAPDVVLLHPEVTEHPAELRWVITSCPRDFSLAVAHPDSPLQELVRQGVLIHCSGEPGVICTRATSRDRWREIAGEVRRAVEDTVLAVQQYAVKPAVLSAGSGANQEEPDVVPVDGELLRDVAPQVLDRYVRPLAGAHGGKVEITKISDGTVWVYLDGACRGCPAAKFTLQQRFQRELNRRVPGACVVEARRRH